MKKFLLVAAVALVAVIALGVAGFAYAQTPNPPTPNYPYGGRGMMGGRGLAGTDSYGPMHDYMLDAVANALGMTPEALQAELDAGKTMWQVAEAKGLTAEEWQKVMLDARSAALQKMVEAGVITQEQADWMNSRMQGRFGQGYGNGACPMGGTGGFGGGFGGGRGGRGGGMMNPGGGSRWSTPGTNPTGNGG